MFNRGDKVVCVNSLDLFGLLNIGHEYIVLRMSRFATDEVLLVGVPGSWRTKRFILANQALPIGNQPSLPSPNDISSSGSNPTGYNPSSSGDVCQPTPWVVGPRTNLDDLLRTKYVTEPSQQAKAPICQHAFKPSRTTPGKTKWCSLCDHRE